MEQKKLSADPSATILGIIALVLTLVNCCCGFLLPIALTLSIIGLISANRSLKEYRQNAENYYPQSRSNAYTGKVLNVISLVINGLFSLIVALYFIIYGAFVFSELSKEYPFYQEYNYENDDYYYEDSDEQELEEAEGDDLLYRYGV